MPARRPSSGSAACRLSLVIRTPEPPHQCSPGLFEQRFDRHLPMRCRGGAENGLDPALEFEGSIAVSVEAHTERQQISRGYGPEPDQTLRAEEKQTSLKSSCKKQNEALISHPTCQGYRKGYKGDKASRGTFWHRPASYQGQFTKSGIPSIWADGG
jgi:hypothetical protein